MRFSSLLLLLASVFYRCDATPTPQALSEPFPVEKPVGDLSPPPLPPLDFDSSSWVELSRIDSSIVLDIRYATENNFMERQIYDCGRCFYRPPVAESLLAAQRELAPRGLGLKMFDCYRPGPYQQRLWDVMPDARYVAPPARGSAHSRGAAADLTLIDLATAEELDMGTPYDYFGEEAYTTTTDLLDTVLANRKLLQEVLTRHGFSTIRTEWWHFNYNGSRPPLSDWVWPCPE